MSPAEIIRRALRDAAVALIEGTHDGIGDAAIDALYDSGWRVVKGPSGPVDGKVVILVEEEAR